MTAAVGHASSADQPRTPASEYRALSKFRLTALVAVAAGVGFYMAVQTPLDSAGLVTLVGTLLGTGLATAGSSAMNQLLEQGPDARMDRTADRPLAAGRMETGQAVRFIIPASLVGIGIQTLAGGWLSAGLLLLAWVVYVAVYTPLKRVTSWSVLVGAIPGALPILVGWTATGRGIGFQAITLFLIMFVWQVPHFLAIAWRYRTDYGKAGFQVAATVDPTGRRTFVAAIGCSAILIPVSLLPTASGLAGQWYYVGALIAGLAFLAFSMELARLKAQPADRQLMWASLVYLPVLFLILILDKTPAV